MQNSKLPVTLFTVQPSHPLIVNAGFSDVQQLSNGDNSLFATYYSVVINALDADLLTIVLGWIPRTLQSATEAQLTIIDIENHPRRGQLLGLLTVALLCKSSLL